MTLPQNAFFRAKLKSFEASNAGLIPVLSAAISLQVSTSGGGFGQVRIADTQARRAVFTILHLDARLNWAGSPNAARSNVALVAYGRAPSLRTSTLELDVPYSSELELDFPIAPMILSQIEEARAGSDPSFLINLRVAGIARYEFDPPPASGGAPYLDPFVAEELRVEKHDSNSPILDIEKGRWIERILPNLGFGRWMLYEVPVENFDGAAQVDVYLQNAVKQFLAGEYKLSVAASRDVVETLERELGANANPAFGDRFGSADRKVKKLAEAFGELTQAMLAYQGAVKSLLAAGSHPERPDELVERPDAEMALWVALSLRRYVGMRLRTTRPPTAERPASG